MASSTGSVKARRRLCRANSTPSGKPAITATMRAAIMRARVCMAASHRPSTPSKKVAAASVTVGAMRRVGVAPNVRSYNSLLSACEGAGEGRRAMEVLDRVEREAGLLRLEREEEEWDEEEDEEAEEEEAEVARNGDDDAGDSPPPPRRAPSTLPQSPTTPPSPPSPRPETSAARDRF